MNDPVCVAASSPIAIAAWEYAPNAWATVSTGAAATAEVRASVLRIAEAVRFDRTPSLRVPFQVGYLPDNLLPQGAMIDTAAKGAQYISVHLGPASPGRFQLGISVGPARGPEKVEDPRHVIVTIGGMRIRVDLIELGEQQTFSKEELWRIARSITAAGDRNDPNTWIDAAEAIPIR